MLYDEFLESEYQKLLEELKSLKKNTTHSQKTKLDKARVGIKAKRLNLVRGKENNKNKKKSDEDIRRLATKSARRIMSKKIMGKIYDDLNDQERIEFNKRKKNKLEMYKRILEDEYKKLKAKYTKASLSKDGNDKTTSDD